MNAFPRRVVKVGGSLLGRDDLVAALTSWIQAQPPAEMLLIVGGGELIDAVRNLDRIRPLDQTMTHWMCIELLRASYDIFCSWFPSWSRIESRQRFDECLQLGFSKSTPTVIPVDAYYARGDRSDVPTDWRTTSDTLAALLAQRTGAGELVLLKSCAVDPHYNLSELVSNQIVDEAFPAVATSIQSVRVETLPPGKPPCRPRLLG